MAIGLMPPQGLVATSINPSSSVTLTNLTATGVITAANGTAAAPSIVFAGGTTDGFSRPSASIIDLSIAGVPYWRYGISGALRGQWFGTSGTAYYGYISSITPGLFSVASGGSFAWTSDATDASGTVDTRLIRTSAGIISASIAGTQQHFRVYDSTPTNYVNITHDGTDAVITTSAGAISMVNLTATGVITAAAGSATAPSITGPTATTGLYFSGGSTLVTTGGASNGAIAFNYDGNGDIKTISTSRYGWAANTTITTGPDLLMARKAAASLQLGATSSTTATNQTFGAHDTTGADKAGANLTIEGGNGTGTGGSGSIIFRAAPVAASSSTANVLATRMTIDKLGIGFYTTAGVALQTGVAVTAAGIHAALVNLGLITA